MSKHEKIPALLDFEVKTIELYQDIGDQFKLDWSRGNYHGSTSRSIAVNKVITFNESFRCKCTLYITKATGKIRPKMVKFVLKRFRSPTEKKVFGKVSVNVSQFFDQEEVDYSVEMESGRSHPPKVTFSFKFKRAGEATDADPDENDLSFIGKEVDSTRDKWDMSTEITESLREDRAMRKMARKTESELSQFMATRRRLSKESPPSGVSQGLRDFLGTTKAKDYAKEFIPVLEVSWPAPVTQNFISMPYPYPPAVFPFIATVIHSGLLVGDDDITESVGVICEKLAVSPLTTVCTNEKRFVTFMMLYILTGSLAEEYHFNPHKVEMLQSALLILVGNAFSVYGKPVIGRAETNLNRFATAQFDVDKLMADLVKSFQEIKATLTFPSQLKTFVFKNLVAMIDARMASKILQNPERFTYTNSMTWSSVITGLETSIGAKLAMCSEVAATIMITRAICDEPTVTADACPHLPKEVILTLMKNVKPDEMMSENVDVSAFVEFYDLDPTVDVRDIEPILDEDYMSLAKHLRVSDWNACELQADLFTTFPYLKKYLSIGNPSE